MNLGASGLITNLRKSTHYNYIFKLTLHYATSIKIYTSSTLKENEVWATLSVVTH